MADSAAVSCSLKQPSQADIDAALEREIETAFTIFKRYAVTDPELSRDAFSVMGRLIANRSSEQIERLERAKGLR
jgi:hypothetical protein